MLMQKDIQLYVKVNGSTNIPGWLMADPGAKGEDTILPKLAIKDSLDLSEARQIEKQTSAPQSLYRSWIN